MTVQRVTATYSAPSAFQSTDLWVQLRSALVAQLPLHNLHWKSPSRPSIRTVQELQIDLVPYEAGRGEQTSQVPGSVLERPLLNVYFVTCEDAETYKVTVKQQIKDWHTLIIQRKNQEWLIVHVVSPDARSAPATFLKIKGAVIDKIRADFNMDKRDRCVQLAWSPINDHPATWVDLITKVKEGILTAFNSVVCQREEEVRRSEGQRQMPGWNFCTYFILKESLASLFEGMGLLEDALVQYDELEFTFFQVLREKNLSWFGTLISPAPKDDSLPLLSLTKKAYRDLILANTISVFDFRIYLLARQCSILGVMGRLVDACKKSSAFLASFSRRLREVEGRLPKFFIESWIYSSATSVVEQCDEWAGPFDLDPLTLSNYQAVKGELLQLAATQLEIIGVSVGHLPAEIPFSMSTPLSAPISNGVPDSMESHSITKAEIVSAIADGDAFCSLYADTTRRAIDMYAKAGHRRFALKLHGTLAALDVQQSRLPNAHQIYSSLPGHYVPHGWTSLGCYMYYRAMKIHSQLEKPKDLEWIHVLLDFLKAYVVDISQGFIMRDEDEATYISASIDDLRSAASKLNADIPYHDHPAITVSLRNTCTEQAGTQDGSFLHVEIKNDLPSKVLIDEVKVVLTGPDSERMVFLGTGTPLNPGATVVRLLCPSPTSGIFLLDHSEIRVSRLLLQWNHKRKPSHSRLAKEPSVLVHVPKDPNALDVMVGQPQSIEFGAPQRIHVTISTGRNYVSHMKLRFSSHAGIKFNYLRADFSEEDALDIESAEDYLIIKGAGRDRSVSFFLPHSDTSSFNAIKVNIKVEYVTAAEPSVNRTLRLSRLVPTLLAIAVNVQDFFRGKRLFSRFTISTTSHQHVRIRSAQLEVVGDSTNNLRIVSCSTRDPEVVTATPTQPGHFLFRIESSSGQVRDLLRLRITYRVFREEVEALIEHSVAQVLSKSPALLHQHKTLVEVLVRELESDVKWVALYSITGQLDAPETPELDGELGAALRETKELLLKNDVKLFDDPATWREIVFPVDVPLMNIVAAVRIGILSNPSSVEVASKGLPLYAGQPVSAVLKIRTCFHWGPGAKKENSYVMRFDVEELLNDWLVSGQKRGDFVAKDGGIFSVPITLVALHHGELSLPRASVTPLPIAGGEVTMQSVVLPGCDTYQEHGAEKVLVLPRGGRSTFLVTMGGNT